ncbi:hypothetical protein ACPPVU_21415 [Mucilaginibacter sp. McL0603]|uniref:hypothetical protein n=1 Tax=Mucilaginibacter sp. McL0603 TaxID=3415670 RepID=UPI003CEB6F7D
MKNLTFLLILIPCIVFGQKKKELPPPPPTQEDTKIAEKPNQCLNSGQYNAKQRRAFFPFNAATTVKLISFTYRDVVYTPIAVNNFLIDYNKVRETKILSGAGIDSLTDLLYNVGFTPIKGKLPLGVAMCYEPRNAILFMDGDGKVTQYIELCFTCHGYYLSSKKIKYTVYCEQKYDLLKSFFLMQGIKYGTILPEREE